MPTSAEQQPLLFLSDVHLGGFSPDKNQRLEKQLIGLVDYCEENNIKIFLLGDLYDYWMEYPNHRPELGERLNRRFETYNKRFGPTLFITGNHDNWTRSYFESIGFTVEPDYRLLNRDGTRILLMHGDGLPDTDGTVQRPAMHRLLRNASFISLYQRLFPPATGLAVMKWFSRLNRLLGQFREDAETLDAWAESRLRNTDTDLVLCGHDHIPRKKEYSFGTFCNLGTFYKHRTVALYNNGHVELVVWNDTSRQLENCQLTEAYAHG
ncbi:MAG: UDP-2,3-diacylglucosamine diphosphatase [Balneolaceae bacterium]|nr:UDP-2,3-diacylglucosamine diphosphatase [Balneolaceae bacterium]